MTLDPIKLPEKFENTLTDCDLALGAYMRAWGGLEMQLSELFRKFLEADVTTATIVLDSGIDQRTVRGILDALGKYRLGKPDYQVLARLLRRTKDAAAIRNRLIHGAWNLNLKMGKIPRQAEHAEWVRLYRPTDPESYEKMYGKKRDQRTLAAHEFTLRRIVAIANDVQALASDVAAFSKAASLLPVRIPQPVF